MDPRWPDPHRYFVENGLHDLVDCALEPEGHTTPPPFANVDPAATTPLPPDIHDLARLHHLARSRRVTTILEFGVGSSTCVLADALECNRREFEEYVSTELRRTNAFELHSVDTSEHWIEACRAHLPDPLRARVRFTRADVRMTTFNGRVCTLYDTIPNVCPDLIYLDGPDQHCALGDVHGLTTAHCDRLPMSADILVLEPFLLPGTLVVVDGRTANARFLKHNLQGAWQYEHYLEEDVHTFELVEPPLGVYNERQIRFCLGDDWPGFGRRRPPRPGRSDSRSLQPAVRHAARRSTAST